MKSLKLLIVALAAVAISAGGAFASVHIGGGNDTTGPNSENENYWEIEGESEVSIDNHSSAENEYEVAVTTGENGISNNTELDDLSTGDVEGEIDVENYLNNADIDFETPDLGSITVDLSNDTTGPQSENENKVEITFEQEVRIHNEARIENEFELAANTGANEVGNNTVVGDVSTGDIEFTSDVTNKANGSTSMDIEGAAPSSSVNVDLSNDTTGPNSENENTVEIKAEAELRVDNHARIENEYEVDANTGNNGVANNTVVGDISTGNIKINFSTYNSAN